MKIILVHNSYQQPGGEDTVFGCERDALRAAGKASIVHHGSIDGVQGNPSLVAYSASKGGLVPLTHVMAYWLSPHGIRVNCINSGALRDSTQGIPVRLTSDNCNCVAPPSL